jgi:TolB-like protein
MVPPGVERVVGQALAKAVPDRQATAEEFVQQLMRASTAQAVAAEARRERGRQRWRAVLAVVSVALLGAAGWWGVGAVRAAMGHATIKRLAVLPLASFTNDTSQEYFVQGVHDALISNLQEAGLTVLGRTSVLRYRGTEEPPRQIARELGVDALIEGSVMRAGDSVEIAVRLIDGRTEAARWQHTYPGDLRNVFALYHGVTRAVAEQIHSTLSPVQVAKLATARAVDPQVYDDYLKGMFHIGRLTPSDLDVALTYFERALRRDSTYALAYLGIAFVWADRAQGFAQGGFESIREAETRASAAARKALALDSTLAEVQGAVAAFRAYHEWDWTGADAAFRKAIAMNPNYPDPHQNYSHVLYFMGRPVEGRAQIDSAVALDSASGSLRGFNGVAYLLERRYDEAIVEFRRALELGNGLGGNLFDALWLKGARAQALAQLRESWAGDHELLDAVNRGYAEGGYRAALHRGADVWASRPPTFWGSTFMAATWYALAGDRERTLERLERGYELHDPNMPYIGVLPHFDLVRDDSRFKDLCRRMNLPTCGTPPSP